MPEPAFTAEALAAALIELLDAPSRLEAMAQAAARLGAADSAERLADAVLALAPTEITP
jgi:UDP-N-acetylglucosamine:LPS N-acetylglucosamine transferase